jgi:predicted amidophosphoribosyltransferase
MSQNYCVKCKTAGTGVERKGSRWTRVLNNWWFCPSCVRHVNRDYNFEIRCKPLLDPYSHEESMEVWNNEALYYVPEPEPEPVPVSYNMSRKYCVKCNTAGTGSVRKGSCWTRVLNNWWFCPSCVRHVNRDYNFEIRCKPLFDPYSHEESMEVWNNEAWHHLPKYLREAKARDVDSDDMD